MKECRETLFTRVFGFEDNYHSSVLRAGSLQRYTRSSVSHDTPGHVWPVIVKVCLCVSGREVSMFTFFLILKYVLYL